MTGDLDRFTLGLMLEFAEFALEFEGADGGHGRGILLM
ncbi:hypothetical protein GXY_03173 [Novacetimonas hansenii ATCC 23769]|uniref:Uncharacterized protein n=1 Tax=Novacetimonas hansenii ATCC 23769 TaxID=714995 RepID=D5QBY8_NOVHA|nr:hypothetical protein GXY_03173 [Novacetimonas hansenii ATCC 23769]